MNSLLKSKIFFNKSFLNNNLIKISFKSFCTTPSESKLINLQKSEDLDDILKNSKIPVIIDFYADWCGPCKRLTPVLEKKLKDNNNFKLVKVNVDNHGELSEKFEVQGIPHVVLYKNGQKVSDFAGFNEAALNKMIGSF